MGNLSVANNKPKAREEQTLNTIARIRTMSTSNLALGKRVAAGYAKMVASVEGREIDKELIRKAENSTQVPWDHKAIHKQQTKLKKLAQKDPALGLPELKAYKLECQEVAQKEGRLPQNSEVTFKPSSLLKDQEANALYIPIHTRTKLGTHVLPALVDTGATRNFLSESTAKKLGLTWKEDDTPKPVVNADGSKCGSGIITLYCDIPMKLDNLWKEERFYQAETGTDQVVLGTPWLASFQPTINWAEGTVAEVLEVPLYVPTRKIKKKISWEDELPKSAPSSVKEEELNSRINKDREKEDTPWSGDHYPSSGIRPGGDPSIRPGNMIRDNKTPTDLTTLQTTLKAKQAQCNNPLERDLIQDYLEDLLCPTNEQQPPEVAQEIEPEQTQNSTGNAGKQIPQTTMEEVTSINDQLCEVQEIKEIPWQQDKAKQVPLPLEVPEIYKDAARRLGLFKPTTKDTTEPKERHKKGIKAPLNGTSNTLTTPEHRPKSLPGLEYLEDLEEEDPITETEHMIVENHGIEQGQEAQNSTLRLSQNKDKPTQRGVKHDLSDPHTRENEHLDQEEGQGLEHMVVEDHGPKKGMAPQLKPQFKPLFFPFATCLPNISMPQDYDLKARHNATLKAYSQASLMGRELNDNQDKSELHDYESSTVNTLSTDLTQSEPTSPWPDQWQLEGLDDDITDLEDPWPDLEGTKTWNDVSTEETPDLMNDAPYATPWGLFGEPRWMTEPDNAIEPEPEEDPYPLTLHHPDKDDKSKLKGELSPQTLNNMTDHKETLYLQNNQCDKEILEQRSLQNKSQGSTSDDKEGTKDTSHQRTHQKSTRPTSDDEEGMTKANHRLACQKLGRSVLNDQKGTTIMELTPLDTKAPPPNQEAPAINNATRGRNPHYAHAIISHPDMTRPRLTQPQNTAHQPERELSMMSLLQTSAHYPETSKQNDRSSGTSSFGTLSASSIQEHADGAKTSLSTMTHGTNADRSNTPPSNDQGSEKHETPPGINQTGTDQPQTASSADQKQTALTTLGIIILAMLTRVQKEQRRSTMTDPPRTVPSTKEQVRQMTRNAECPRCRHWAQEEPQYKNPPKNTTNAPSNSPVLPTMPTTPNNTPDQSPCPTPPMTPPLRLKSEDSGNKEKSTTTPGKATTSSIHGGATTTAAIPGTVARRWEATKIMLPTRTTTASPGIPVRQWAVTKVKVIPRIRHTPWVTMPTMKTTSNERRIVLLHPGTSPLDKNTRSSTMSSPILSANNSPTTPHSECWGNANPSTTSHASVSTYAWMAPRNDSQERSRQPTLTTQIWRNSFTIWNGTYVRKVSLTHSTKAAASISPTLLSTNKGPRSSGPCPMNGNDNLNASGQQQRPSTCASMRKPPRFTCSYSKTTGSPPPHSTTCNEGNTSHNPRTPSGGKYSDKTMLYTTRSSTSKDIRT